MKKLKETPYPGLRPYSIDEQNKFFGRDADAEILIDKVLTNRLTLLFAASGVGKSSLLQAAVIPRLKSPTGENLEVVYHIDWVSEPFSSVRTAVLETLHSRGNLPESAADEAGKTLAELLEFCGLFVRHPLVLILDQFEEFFRYQRATTSFQPFIEQLTAVITNPKLPVNIVLSMREDFALELNAFKPRLPTILFENFYRLEKLGRVGARAAIITPVEQIGFHYEPVLLEALLDDLLSRELDRNPNSPVAELRTCVEPPYLQIVCLHLWNLKKDNNNHIISLKSYLESGKAQGILKGYLDAILKNFSDQEKTTSSIIFDHLVGNSGVKIAYTIEGLERKTKIKKKSLSSILEKLEHERILRKKTSTDNEWYELYHDMFAESINTWNDLWKKRGLKKLRYNISLLSLVIIFLSFYFLDSYIVSGIHLRLNNKLDKSDYLELWKGRINVTDIFNRQNYIAQIEFKRSQLEIDQRFDKSFIDEKSNLYPSVIKKLPIDKRILSYAEIGDFDKVAQLYKNFIGMNDTDLSLKTKKQISSIRSPEIIKLFLIHTSF